MESSTKASLRKLLLDRRDSTSGDMLKIASQKIQSHLKKISAYRNAKKIGIYYSIGSEIPTQDIVQELLSLGKTVCLPRVSGNDMSFRAISDFASLEHGIFDTMEPKERCAVEKSLDVILVPAVGMSASGARLGYGRGFYDRFLGRNKPVSISVILEKQMVGNIPQSRTDQTIDWIVTENAVYKTSHTP